MIEFNLRVCISGKGVECTYSVDSYAFYEITSISLKPEVVDISLLYNSFIGIVAVNAPLQPYTPERNLYNESENST